MTQTKTKTKTNPNEIKISCNPDDRELFRSIAQHYGRTLVGQLRHWANEEMKIIKMNNA